MKNTLEIFILLICLAINYLISNYLSFIFILILLIIYLFDEKKAKLKKVLVNLEVINQIYILKEEKLNIVFGESNLPFEQRCKILSQNSKYKMEKDFFIELSLCNNKTNIDSLIVKYKYILNKNQKGIIFEYFLFLLFLLIMIKLFPSFSYSSSLKLISFIPSLFIFFDYCLYKRKMVPSFSSLFNQIYIEFYSSLSYLRPMESLIKVVDKYPYKNNPYALLLDDINNNKMSFDKKIYEKYEMFPSIYKLCFKNKFSKDFLLETYYKKCIDNNSSTYLLIKENLISICLILITVIGVFL